TSRGSAFGLSYSKSLSLLLALWVWATMTQCTAAAQGASLDQAKVWCANLIRQPASKIQPYRRGTWSPWVTEFVVTNAHSPRYCGLANSARVLACQPVT